MARKLAAILAADVAGFSRHMEVDEESALATLEGHRQAAAERVTAFDGRVFATAGDSLLAEFPSAVQAVRCALEVQEVVETRNQDLEPERRMHYRIGVHVGDVMVAGENLYGDGVNVADRLQGLAPARGVCISEGAYIQVHKVLHLAYRDLGRHTVKGISEPIHVYRVNPADAGATGGARPRRRRLVVAGLAALVVVLVAAGGLAWWRPWREAPQPVPPREAGPVTAQPRHHFKVGNPAAVEPEDALTIYERIQDRMAGAYADSGIDVAATYQEWRKYTALPYLSEPHGRRYLNNYANAKAEGYGTFGPIEEMPVGAAIAKDSFEVTKRGDVYTGPLFLMEKMPEGFNAASGDWRFTMIRPNGGVFGRTGGPNGERVAFCAECHAQVAGESDYLFFPPENVQRRPLRMEP